MVVVIYIQNLQDERVRLEALINAAVTQGGTCCCCCCGGGGCGGGGGDIHTEPAG